MQPPLSVKIPGDYAEILDCHPTEISHVNAGRRSLSRTRCIVLLEHARTDPRLAGLTILDLDPGIEDLFPFLVGPIRQWLNELHIRG